LLALSRFTTTAGEKRSLKQYVEDLKPNQTDVYYLVGDSIERLKSNPKLESANARGIEVLLLTDPIDAFWTQSSLDFGGKPLKSLSKGDVDFGLVPLINDDAGAKEDPGADEAMTIAVIKDSLGERVSDVRVSQRLTTSASCLVAGGFGRDRQLEKMLAQQNKGAGDKPILEINMRHPLVAAIAEAKDAAADLSFLLLEQAQILDGELPEDPAAFAGRLNQLVLRGLPKKKKKKTDA
jgi:molecular chaperone HtpG